MRVTSTSTLLWLVHLSVLYSANGADSEEVYKPRRWTAAAGDGPYRLVVSSEWETLDGEESVSLAVAQEKKKKEAADYDKVTQRAMGKQRRKPEQRKRWRAPTSTGPPQTMSYNLYNHFRPLEQGLPSESLIPFLDFGRKLSTNSIESSSTPRGEETKSTLRTRLLPVNRTQLLPQNKTETTNVHFDLQSNESGINLHAVLSPDYGLKLNKTSDDNSTQNSIITNESKTSDNTTSSEITESVTEIPDMKTEKPKNSSIALTNPKTNDALSTETAVPVPSPKPTARILSTAVVTSVSVKESPWAPRIKTNLTRPETYQRLAWKNFSSDSAPLHYSPESRVRGDNYTLIMQQQNLRRKMYTTYRPKTTTYRPVTFRNVFRRNFTGLGTGVVHILSTPPTYIEVPKILANAPAKIVSSEALLSTVEPVYSNVTVKPSPSTLEPTIATRSTKVYTTYAVPTTQASTTTSIKTTTPTTTQSTTTPSTTMSTEETVSTTSSTPSSSTTVTTTTPTTTPSTTVSTTSTTPEPTTITTTEATTLSTTTTTVHPSTDRPIQTSISYSLSSSVTQATVTPPEITETSHKAPVSENASEEIEFKPLDLLNATRRPNLLWLYNQRNHSLGNNPPVTYTESHIGLVSYVLAGLALIPLILGLSVLARQIFKKSKKKVLDESEYSSEYNRTPLPTKLPRVPAHINWEGEKQPTLAPAPPPVPVTKWEFSRDKLRLQTVLGQGNFGQVWKAEADDLSGHEGSTRLVAVKTVKEGSSPREKEDLLRELGIMQELGAHPNVVTLLGCCTEKEPYLLIMEYVMYGKLLAFLREHRTRAHYFNFSDLSSALTSRDLTFFSYCVARGMEYLVTKGIIHRDLAARNILVDHTKLCKIADFGMSRNVRDTGQIYEQRPNRGALPIRWMAPESLHLSLFTHKSDVWSFGILLWEIITLGSTPYSKMGAREVMREVREGYRLEKPKHCRAELYRVAAKCWQSDPGKRPSFSELKQDLANLLADEQTNGEYVDLEALTEEMADHPT